LCYFLIIRALGPFFTKAGWGNAMKSKRKPGGVGVFATTLIVSAVFLSAERTDAKPVNKCTTIQAQCAVEIGGRCDPETGRWEYGNYGNRGSGGTNRGGAFDGCISRKLKQRK
jgi:hypothetical protein